MTGPPMLTINGRFLGQRTTGVQRYAREILSELDHLLHENGPRPALNARIIVPVDAELPALRSVKVRRAAGNGILWEQLILPTLAQGVTLSLGNVGPLVLSNHILCIHDVNVLTAPTSYNLAFRSYYRILQPLLGRRAARVVTVSHFSAQMLSESGVCPREKISIIPNGHEHVRRWAPDNSSFAAREAYARPFVFTLGSRAPHKNIEMLFGLAAELDAIGLDICVAGISSNIFSAIETNAVPPNVRFLGFVTDDDLAALYRNALCFAFPSLTEGFGLPALEALALGCPVIASHAASLPEVCGDAALYADPRSPRAWLEQIKRLHAEPEIAQGLRAKAARQVEKFSWAKSARQYFDLVMSLPDDIVRIQDRAASELE